MQWNIDRRVISLPYNTDVTLSLRGVLKNLITPSWWRGVVRYSREWYRGVFMLRGVYKVKCYPPKKVPTLGTLIIFLTCLNLFPRCRKLSWGWPALFNSLQSTDSFCITNINDLLKEIIDKCRQKILIFYKITPSYLFVMTTLFQSLSILQEDFSTRFMS